MGTTWLRDWGTEMRWSTGNQRIARLSPGLTLARAHFGIRWIGITTNEQDFQVLADDFMAIGLVSQSSATGLTPPNALTAMQNANPPLERWLWWSTMSLTPVVMGTEHPDVMLWNSTVNGAIEDASGQVHAAVPAGDTLDVYISWSPWFTDGWQARGNVSGSLWSSCLVLT